MEKSPVIPATTASEYIASPRPPRVPRMLLAGYLVHLLFPALILADVVTSRLQGKISFLPLFSSGLIPAFAAGVCVVWLAAGIGFLLAASDRQAFPGRIAAPLLCFYTVAATLFFIEAAARVLNLAPTPIPHLDRPGIRIVTKMDPALYPGVSGAKTYSTNALGLRGPLPPSGRAYRIVAIGASTTNCFTLDDSEAWPQLLMDGMNARPKTLPVWVGNAGLSGFNAVNHLVLMQWLPGYLRTDMLIFLTGGNDLQAGLSFGGAPLQKYLEKQAGYEGELPPGVLWRTQKPVYPRFLRLKIFRLARQSASALQRIFQHPVSMGTTEEVKYRKTLGRLPIVPLPDLSVGLKEYRGRLLALAARCRDLRQRCLFLTQPSIWRDEMTPAERSLLWSGYVGRVANPKGRVSTGDMAKAMDLYNRALLDTCRDSGLECFDLASRIPKDTSAFYDDMHFNENGARLVATALRQYLLSRPPFGEASH